MRYCKYYSQGIVICHQRNAITLLITRIIGIQDCLHVTHYFVISSNGVVYLDRLSGAHYCISRSAVVFIQRILIVLITFTPAWNNLYGSVP